MDGIALANTGDHPALSLLNTRLRPWGERLELLDSGRGLLDWMVSVELLDEGERRQVSRRFSTAELDAVSTQARELREWLRGEVDSWSSSEDPAGVSPTAERRLNRLLAMDLQYAELGRRDDGSLELTMRRRWESAEQVLAPLAAAAAELFAEGDRELVRLCDGPRCALWFYDRTRSHRRRWCSQAVCGNRDKVKNHRARQHAGDAAR